MPVLTETTTTSSLELLPDVEYTSGLSAVSQEAARLYREDDFGTDPDTGQFAELANEYSEYRGGLMLVARVGYYGPLQESLGFNRQNSDQLNTVRDSFLEVRDESARDFLHNAIFYRMYREAEDRKLPTSASSLIDELSHDIELVPAFANVERRDLTLEHLIGATLFYEREIAGRLRSAPLPREPRP